MIFYPIQIHIKIKLYLNYLTNKRICDSLKINFVSLYNKKKDEELFDIEEVREIR